MELSSPGTGGWRSRATAASTLRNPNHVTIACETEDGGDAGQPVTDQQYRALVCAASEAKRRYPDSLRYLVRHADISPQSRPGCPGDRWLSSGRFEALAQTLGLKIVR
jgi:N-acetyl-anhydromuramyl-L-alanine amidase AmpD